jgi:hypothetical protein
METLRMVTLQSPRGKEKKKGHSRSGRIMASDSENVTLRSAKITAMHKHGEYN